MPQTQRSQAKKGQVFDCELGICNRPVNLLLPQNGLVLEHCRITASQNHHSYQFADKWAERGYYDESNVVLCMSSSITALVCKLAMLHIVKTCM